MDEETVIYIYITYNYMYYFITEIIYKYYSTLGIKRNFTICDKHM